MVHSGLVKSLCAVEGADASDHHVGALIVAGTVEKNLIVRAAGAGGVGAKAGGTSVSTVLASTVDCIGSDGAAGQTFEVEEVAAA